MRPIGEAEDNFRKNNRAGLQERTFEEGCSEGVPGLEFPKSP
jgi:hypothetical protein